MLNTTLITVKYLLSFEKLLLHEFDIRKRNISCLVSAAKRRQNRLKTTPPSKTDGSGNI